MNVQEQVKVRVPGHSCLTKSSDYIWYKVKRSKRANGLLLMAPCDISG